MMRVELERAILYVEENLEHDLSLNDVARYCNYSPYYLSVLFHQSIGETMKSYIKKRRLTRAAEELKKSESNIIHIAITYGYSSQEAFSRAFAERFGVTPHKYRRTQTPIQETYPKHKLSFSKGGGEIMKDTIKNLQEKMEARYDVNILHVLNGSCMLERFSNEKLMNKNATYMSFNEAMCWGEADTELFSPAFIKARVQSLQTTEEEYRQKVLEALEPLFKGDYGIIVLWFGDDMFCQINMMTILAYLDQTGYKGDVLFCMALERRDEMLDHAFEMDSSGYLDIYRAVLCNRQKPPADLLPVTYQAVDMYLNYRTSESPIVKYIKRNAGKENLVAELLALFPEYGLGDLQYKMMIEEVMYEDEA